MGAITSRRGASRRRIQELADWLAAGVPARTDVLRTVTRALAVAFGTDQTVAYGFQDCGDEPRLAFLESPYPRIPEVRRALPPLLERIPAGFAHYDPRMPPRDQRNRVVTLEELRRTTGLSVAPISRLLSEHGMATSHQLRVLICDGDALLAWVGALRDRPFRADEADLLHMLVRPLRNWLVLERSLDVAPWAHSALDVAMEHLGTAAVVVRRPLRLLHCNDLARAMLSTDNGHIMVSLRDDLDGRGAGNWTVLPLERRAGKAHFLALLHRPPRDPDGPASTARLRYQLTRGQLAVLRLVALGEPNKAIASALSCSVSAVEQHLTKLMRRYGVEGRGQLVSRFWTEAL